MASSHRGPMNNYGRKMHQYGPNKYIVSAAKQRYYRNNKVSIPRIISDVKYLKSLVNSEPQPFVVTTSNNVNWNGSIVSLSTVVQGDQLGQRTGDRILPRYLAIRGYCHGTIAVATQTRTTWKIMVVRLWSESTSAAPTAAVTDALAPGTVGTAHAPLSFLNQDNVGPKGDRVRRIEVLRSETFITQEQGAQTGASTQNYLFDWNIEMNGGDKKDHIEYFSNATGEPISGGLYFIIINDVDAASAAFPSYWVNSKMTFYDN